MKSLATFSVHSGEFNVHTGPLCRRSMPPRRLRNLRLANIPAMNIPVAATPPVTRWKRRLPSWKAGRAVTRLRRAGGHFHRAGTAG